MMTKFPTAGVLLALACDVEALRNRVTGAHHEVLADSVAARQIDGALDALDKAQAYLEAASRAAR